ncbi:MAG TPA: Stk1 family PASTA domain-containing Ser/Thr kinase [Thermoleophilaceae bacterium]|nr:Stk1 family PASTA domain-containing Ser/Thr kinase [Thermoleophilaceae bacterium]
MTEVADNTLVDGRYRVVRRIGSGGMADVYLAEDAHLGREVALKMLHRRFAQDQEFIERFRREATSAAGLQHPHVVGVYDRGEHEGTYYIAMEFLPGRTLKQVVVDEAPLPQEQVIDLGVQILTAAGFAHRNGVIHRDFKPQNVIVDEAWHAKVTDFGIARAGASEMTETGSIMGTAQYLSPEQAQGHAVTGASDLYSIGVMLYELLAGRLPFGGDSAVAVALKHLSEPPVPISQLRPDVHPLLESVVMAALAKNPQERWQSAEEFAAALEAARVQIESGENGGEHAAVVPLPMVAAAPELGGETAATQMAPLPEVVAVAEPEERRPRRWPWFATGLLALLLIGLLALLASGALESDKVEVPKVTGMQIGEARAELQQLGFEVREIPRRSELELDQVIDQDRNPGEEAEKGSLVTLGVSTGPGNALVPSVKGLPQAQAAEQLRDAGLKVTLDAESSDKVRKGLAIRTVPREGTEVTRGTRVRMFVSSGPERVGVPGVVGLTQESAEARLRDEGLRPSVREARSDEPEGEVISQAPAAGARVDRGASVTIVVSSGKEEVEVPNVTGISAGDAANQLSAEGLKAVRRERSVSDPEQDGQVIEQRPPPGSTVEMGRSVVIVVGKLVEEEEEPPTSTAPPEPSTTAPETEIAP